MIKPKFLKGSCARVPCAFVQDWLKHVRDQSGACRTKPIGDLLPSETDTCVAICLSPSARYFSKRILFCIQGSQRKYSPDDLKLSCAICDEPVGLDLDGNEFVPCECAFPVCRPCYEYIRKNEGNRCPRCKEQYKRKKGECPSASSTMKSTRYDADTGWTSGEHM